MRSVVWVKLINYRSRTRVLGLASTICMTYRIKQVRFSAVYLCNTRALRHNTKRPPPRPTCLPSKPFLDTCRRLWGKAKKGRNAAAGCHILADFPSEPRQCRWEEDRQMTDRFRFFNNHPRGAMPPNSTYAAILPQRTTNAIGHCCTIQTNPKSIGLRNHHQ